MSDSVSMKSNTMGILRYAFGSTFIMAVALAYQWPLSHLLPVLSLGFLAPGKQALRVKEAFGFILVVTMACIVGVLLGTLIDFPMVLLPLTGLTLFYIFYTRHPFVTSSLKVWLIIAVLLLPMLNLILPSLAVGVLKALVLGSVGSVLLAWVLFIIFPEPKKMTSQDTKDQKEEKEESDRTGQALKSTFVLLPVLIFFYLFQWSDAILTLIFIGLLSMQPSLMKDFAIGKALIIGNLIGAIFAILAFNLLVVVPNFTFIILIVALVGLVLGNQFFSGKKAAPLFNMAYSTFLLLLGSMTASSDENVDAQAWTRVILIMVAVFYVVIIFGVIERWNQKKKL